jgi:hypothetical protein
MQPEHQEYEGHRIELRQRENNLALCIDNAPVRYGQLPGGLYFLHEYAYDWSDNLMDLVRKSIDYRRTADDIRREHESNQGEK